VVVQERAIGADEVLPEDERGREAVMGATCQSSVRGLHERPTEMAD